MSDVNINYDDIQSAFLRFYTQRKHEFPSLKETKAAFAGWHFHYDPDKNSITVFLTANSSVELQFNVPERADNNYHCNLGGFKLVFTYCLEQISWSMVTPNWAYSMPCFDLSFYLPVLNELKEVATKMDEHFRQCKKNVMSSRIVESLIRDSLERTDIGDIEISHIDGSAREVSLTKIINGDLRLQARADANNYPEVLTDIESVLVSIPDAISDNKFFTKKKIFFRLIKNGNSYEELKSKFVSTKDFNEDYTDADKYLPDVRLLPLPKSNEIINDFPELCQLFDSLGYNYGVLPNGSWDQPYKDKGISFLCVQLTDDYGWAFYLTPQGKKLRMVAGKFRDNEFCPGNPSYGEVRYPFDIVELMNDVKLRHIINFFNKMAKYVSAKDLYEYKGNNKLIIYHILRVLLPKGFLLKTPESNNYHHYRPDGSIDILFDYTNESFGGISFKYLPRNITELFDMLTFLGDNAPYFKQLIDIAEKYPRISIDRGWT